jgi:hypothetical protein
LRASYAASAAFARRDALLHAAVAALSCVRHGVPLRCGLLAIAVVPRLSPAGTAPSVTRRPAPRVSTPY